MSKTKEHTQDVFRPNLKFKDALINVFILTMAQMTACIMKLVGVMNYFHKESLTSVSPLSVTLLSAAADNSL